MIVLDSTIVALTVARSYRMGVRFRLAFKPTQIMSVILRDGEFDEYFQNMNNF